ncbi:MAG: hypothetical protein LAP85_23800 [Acidobacteriia bacterium]|nr:hypothetical protein [Terriglobia bacterium]
MRAMRKIGRGLLYSVAVLALGTGAPGPTIAEEPLVSIVADRAPAAPAIHGLEKMMAALRAGSIACEKVTALETARGNTLVVVGLGDGEGPAAQLLKTAGLPKPQGAEALMIRRIPWKGKSVLLITGADARGLMYAELDVADRIGWSSDRKMPFSEVRDTSEKPDAPQRALSIYTMNRAYWESRFYDEAYWARYLDMLAQNRFDSLVVIFGYENGGFLAPCYPYFFDVEEFPDVRMVGITREQQQRNLAALNRLIQMAHDRGVDFTVGIWDHIYRGGVQGGGLAGADEATRRPTPGLVWGVTGDNLIPYTKAALAKFIRAVPDLDAIQFRMHDESGLKPQEQLEFWRSVFRMMKENAPKLRLDLRAKGLPDSVIEAGLDIGVTFRITTKYWMEQMGMPFHPTHINTEDQSNRRHSYADLLRYPQKYQLHWRLWPGGTARVLLWGDPEYVRRFVGSTHLYDGDGFEVNEPLTTKMEAQPHDMKPFELLKPQYRYYDYEFERYWHFLQVFGRIGYSPGTPAEVWQREFERRIGKEAAPYLEKGLHQASWVLPRIVASCIPYSYFPMTRGWVEKERIGDLPFYAMAQGSDIQQFASFDEEAQNLIAGNDTAKTRPPETSRWFAQAAREIDTDVAEAEKRIGSHRNKEFNSTIIDLKILAGLALYHARRIPAAVSYRLFERTKDVGALDDAIAQERNAVEAWRGLVAAAGDVYADDLMMGLRSSGLCGHWRDELAALEKGLSALERRRQEFRPAGTTTNLQIAHAPVRRLQPGEEFAVRATVSGPNPIAKVRAAYRFAPGEYRYVDMKPAGPWFYTAAIAVPARTSRLEYFIEASDETGKQSSFPAAGSQPVAVITGGDVEPPLVIHRPVTSAPAGKPLAIVAQVQDPSGVKWVRLRYRNVNQQEDYRTLPMLPAGRRGQYQAVVPAESLSSKWDFMYLIEVMDNQGNGRIYPDFNKETPYVVVRLARSKMAPQMRADAGGR